MLLKEYFQENNMKIDVKELSEKINL